MEQYSYTSTHPLGHTGPVTGSLYLYLFYDIYLLQLGSYPMAAVVRLIQKWERDNYVQKGETIRKAIQKQGIHKVGNEHKKKEY